MKKQKMPVGTIGLAVMNIAVFFMLSFGGMTEDAAYMAEHGAMYAPYFFDEQEYYRIFTCMFLHFGIGHLVNNMVTLVVIGRYIEPVVGTIRFLVIYLLSGLGGNVLSIVWELRSGDYAVSAGASGAIFGMLGSLLTLTLMNRGRIAGITLQNMFIMIALSLYSGFTSEGVDNAAHIGGLLSGFLIALLCCRKNNAKRCTDSQ